MLRCALTVSAAIFGATTGAWGQWTSDAGANTPLAVGPGEQVQPKLRLVTGTTFGVSIWSSWFDNAGGGYDVRLQRLSGAGVAHWASGGVLIADRGFSSTVDYALADDGQGNAILAFNDDRPGGNQITVAKVLPDSTQAWGPGGVQLTAGAGFRANPKIAWPFVAWVDDATIKVQRLSDEGAAQWGAPLTIAEAGRSLLLCDLRATPDANSFIVLWARPTTSSALSPKHLYAQRFTGAAAAFWASPTIVFDASSIQNGYFPRFEADDAGASTYCWYETGGTRNVYVQRVRPDGSEVYAHNGVGVGAPGPIRLEPAFAAVGDEAFVVWSETNAAQSQFALRAQRISGDGTRAWGDSGAEILATSSNQKSFLQAAPARQGMFASWVDARTPTGGVLMGATLGPDGSVACHSPLMLSSIVSGKSRVQLVGGGGVAVVALAWSDSRADGGNIYAQSMGLRDARLGATIPVFSCLGDLDDGSGTGTPDGGVTIDDLLYYIAQYEAGSPGADFDDGTGTGAVDCGVTIDDLLYYIGVAFEGDC